MNTPGVVIVYLIPMPFRTESGAGLGWLGVFWLLLLLCAPRGGRGAEEGEGIASGNATVREPGKKQSLAERVDQLVKKEFAEDVEEAEQGVGKTFNETAKDQQVGWRTSYIVVVKV